MQLSKKTQQKKMQDYKTARTFFKQGYSYNEVAVLVGKSKAWVHWVINKKLKS